MSEDANFTFEGLKLDREKDTFVLLPQILKTPSKEITLAVSFRVEKDCPSFCNLLWIGDPEQPTKPLFSIYLKNGLSLHVATALGSLDTGNGSVLIGRSNFLVSRMNFETGNLVINVGGSEFNSQLHTVTNPTPKVFNIGLGGAPKNSFTGTLSNLSIWNRMLDAGESSRVAEI